MSLAYLDYTDASRADVAKKRAFYEQVVSLEFLAFGIV